MIKLNTQYLCPTTGLKKWMDFESTSKAKATSMAIRHYKGSRIRRWEVVNYKRVVKKACNGVYSNEDAPRELRVANSL